MPSRRVAPSLNSQDPPVRSASTPTSPAYIQFPQGRSNSPSHSGLANLLSKSSRWFRKPSDPRLALGATEPRSSTSSVAVRKPKISRPTDPRPILQHFQSEPRVSDASKSALDLSSQSKSSFDSQRPFPISQPSSPDLDGGLGDLRNISRKTWSKSADDLGSFSISSYSSADLSFQHRVQEYRNRSNSSATLHPASGGTSGPGSPIKHIFPTIITNVPLASSLPPEGAFTSPDTGISINVSSPASEEEQPLIHHSRNTSFVPRLPSKLSASKLGFPPTSPKRKGSSDRDLDLTKDKENDRSGPSGTRGVFPFSLPTPGSSKHPAPTTASPAGQNTSPSPSSLLSPDMLEPGGNHDNRDSRRTSQIVYNCGFINRMGDAAPWVYAQYRPYSTATHLTLSKGWKAFKAELKGSKLYFYKPPGDRGAAIKELFPTDIIPAPDEAEEDGDADPLEDAKSGRGREDGAAGRKKRAYWGRRTHPDLAHSDSGIDKGSFEALLHEAVFATTFLLPSTTDEEKTAFTEPRRPEWKDFTSAILLCLPILAGREKFENEFTRLCDNLVGGAEEKAKDFERSCISWMASEYLRYHGVPADESAWNDWQKETIPTFSWNEAFTFGIPKSVSTQAVFAPSPNPNMSSPSMTGFTFSPNLGTFSPRPGDDAKMASLMEALGTSGLQTPASPVKPLSPRQKRPQHPFAEPKQRVWVLLVQDGFTREVLSLLDPTSVAHSLKVFHRRILQKLPDNLTADHILKADSNPGTSPDTGAGAAGSSPSAALFGSDDRPHWLTRLLLMQILGADSSSSSGEEHSALSRTYSRSEVISMWASIGELCRVAGDECSWMAISAALCSRPVARLNKAWRRADRQSILAVESWIYPGGDGQVALVNGPILTPWGGEIRDRAKHFLEQAREERTDEVWAVNPLLQTRDLFEGLRTKISLCPRNTTTDDLPPDVEKLLNFWQDFVEEKSNQNSLASKFQRVDQFMSISLAAEPRRKGLFEPFFWSQSISTPHILCHPLTPLLFMDPLPTVTLLDRGQIWRGRLESGPTKLSVEELQRLRGLDVALTPASRSRPDASSSKDKLFNIGDVDIRETAIPVYDGELLLIARSDLDPLCPSRPTSRAPSRPPSSVVDGFNHEKPMTRSPSIRVKPGSSQGLERKSSVARRSSLPSISPRPNAIVTEVSSERPIRVIVQAGTLDRLVGVLVHGLQGVSVAVADDNGETSLRDGKTRDLVVDRSEFARVWWHVFRSFVTPIVFFELLRKRFLGSRPSGSLSSTSSLHVIQFRSEVLETIKEWVISGGGAQDCLDSVQLYEALRSFLESPLERPSFDSSSTEDANDVGQAWDALDSARQTTLTAFHAHTQRPPSIFLADARPLNPIPRARFFGNKPPAVDDISADELVDNLNAMGSAAFSNISEEDLFITADLLEVQSADRTGWFSTREVQLTDDIDIQSIYSHLMDVQPSSLISELSQDNIYRLLPPSVRSCIRAFGILRKWAISKLVAPKLGVRVRQARMDLFLRAIEIARLRSMDAISASRGCGDRPCVRSFVEAVLSSAVISCESRMHHRPWQNIANVRGVQCDSLVGLLSRPAVPKKTYGDPLAMDVSWILERILELVSIPNVVTTSSDNDSIINLDKRRHLCNLILNTPSLASKKSRPREDFERLNNIEREVNLILLDLRSIRDEAQREAIQAQGNGSMSAKKTVRPFQRLVAFQQEKYKREKYLYDRLSKDKKQEQLRNERRDDQINKAMRARKPMMTQVQKQHRMKKSYSSAFFQLMRPISSAFSDSMHAPALKRSPAELDFLPSGKPSLVLSVVDARVAQFINNERSFTFQLDTEDGGHYLLQAISKQEMVRWIEQINRVAKLAAKRRLTYLGNSPKPQLADHIHDHPSATAASRDPRAVFGVDLEFLIEREANGAQPEIGAIPSVIQTCLSEVEFRGLSEVGIYRIAGATSEVQASREAFNRGESPITPDTDIHAVCDLVKSWFRLLPEPVFPSSSYFNVIEAMKLENLNSRLSCIRSVVHGLPQAHFDLLKRVAEHLDRVTDYEEHNQMTAEALAIVFSPNLLRAPQNDFALILSNMGHTHKLVKALITHFHVIFDDELEADHDVEEDEMEGPILEEDEEEEEEEIDSPAAGDEP